MKPWTLILLAATQAHGADPRVERWIRSTLPPGARAMGPDVHDVKVDEQFVTVESAGLSMQSLGALEVRPYDGGKGIRRFAFRIPRHPKPAARPPATPLGVIGAFSNGVPGQSVLIEIPAQKAKELKFTCGMGMYRGSLIVR